MPDAAADAQASSPAIAAMAHAVLGLLTSHSQFEAILSSAQEAAERASALAGFQSIAVTSLLPAADLPGGSQSTKEVKKSQLHLPVTLLSQTETLSTCLIPEM